MAFTGTVTTQQNQIDTQTDPHSRKEQNMWFHPSIRPPASPKRALSSSVLIRCVSCLCIHSRKLVYILTQRRRNSFVSALCSIDVRGQTHTHTKHSKGNTKGGTCIRSVSTQSDGGKFKPKMCLRVYY